MSPTGRLDRVVFRLTAVVVAGALVALAVVGVLDYRRTNDWNTFISNAMQADLSGRMVTSEILRTVPADGSMAAPDTLQEFVTVNGVGSAPAPPQTGDRRAVGGDRAFRRLRSADGWHHPNRQHRQPYRLGGYLVVGALVEPHLRRCRQGQCQGGG